MQVETGELKKLVKPFIGNVKKLSKNADKIFIEPEGEEVLVTILQLQRELDEVIAEVKTALEEKALGLDSNFSSIQADKIKVFYREYGSKYYLDESQKDLVPEGIIAEKISYSVNSKAVEDFVKEKGGMPAGIKEVNRNKSLSFSLKNGE